MAERIRRNRMLGPDLDSVWNWTARATGRTAPPAGHERQAIAGLLHSPRLWGLVIANALNMSVYSLWTNWTTSIWSEARTSP